MNFFKVKTLDEAIETVIANLPQNLARGDFVRIENSLNKVAASDIFSADELPPYNRSTVDGYAVSAHDVYGASESVPSILKVTGAVKIGEMPSCELGKNEAIAIATGAVVPNGANAVVMIEHTEKFNNGIAIYKPLSVRENVVLRGEDIKKGDKIVSRGDKLTALTLGILAGVGVQKIEVFSAPKISIISTGDELVGIDEFAHNGKIRDINSTIISSLCQRSGFEVVNMARVLDDKKAIFEAVEYAAKISDIVLISGGSSVGARDFTEAVLRELGEVLIHGLALKPGKPTMVAKVKDTLVFGLAGHPLAAALTFKVLIEKAIMKARGQVQKLLCNAKTTTNFASTAGRTTIQPVALKDDGNEIWAEPIFLKSAHIAQLAKADGYIILPYNCEGLKQGERVKVFAL